jgi:hypothetical protein
MMTLISVIDIIMVSQCNIACIFCYIQMLLKSLIQQWRSQEGGGDLWVHPPPPPDLVKKFFGVFLKKKQNKNKL